MPKSKNVDINQLLLKAHRIGVKNAIDVAARTGTSLIVFKDGKLKSVRPKYKYIRVPIDSSKKKQGHRSSRRKSS